MRELLRRPQKPTNMKQKVQLFKSQLELPIKLQHFFSLIKRPQNMESLKIFISINSQQEEKSGDKDVFHFFHIFAS